MHADPGATAGDAGLAAGEHQRTRRGAIAVVRNSRVDAGLAMRFAMASASCTDAARRVQIKRLDLAVLRALTKVANAAAVPGSIRPTALTAPFGPRVKVIALPTMSWLGGLA